MRSINKIMERRLQGDCRSLWENEDALKKYLKKLKELMEADEADKPKKEDYPEKLPTFTPQQSHCNKQLNFKQMSKTILAKFKVGSVTNFGNNNEGVNMSPVIGDSNENKSFSLYTPSGKIEMHITNPEAIGFFQPSKEYYVEFKEAD